MKTRAEREQDLQRLLPTSGGRYHVINTYREKCLPLGQMPQAGMLVSQMIQAILDHEYPTEEETDSQ